jgi:Abnormal spindle-like microcephaly-assoc'd, ASPM-SPD-2-Hydin
MSLNEPSEPTVESRCACASIRCLLRLAFLVAAILGVSSSVPSEATMHPATNIDRVSALLAPSDGPVVSLSPTSLNFGNEQLGTSSPSQTITLTNTGDSSLSISSIAIVGSSAKDFSQTHSCKSSLGAGASCTISVTFSPTQLGTRSKSLDLTDNAAGSPQSVSLTGVGVAPEVTLSPSTFPNGGGSSLSFGSTFVGSNSSPQSVTLNNTGTAALNINSIAASGDFSQTNSCGTSVAAGSSCSISVVFTPTAAWSRSGSILITDNALNSPQQVVLLVGMGNNGPQASLSTTSVSFGKQLVGTTSVAQTLTLTNTGTAVLYINSILASGDYSQTNTCGTSLTAGAVCNISVTFTPSYHSQRTGYITVNDTDPSFLQTVNLTGQGIVPSSTVAVTPGASSITPTQTQQFTATINGVASSNVNWSVDSIAGGNTTVGTISSSGLYTPPTAPGPHTIQAVSVAEPTQSASAWLIVTNYEGTFTYKNDNLHTGQNLGEIVLTTGNVNANQFGKLFSYPVDGYVFAQPLYVAGVNIPNQGVHNVLYVATENDSVFAFDADNQISQPLWQTSFIDPANGITTVPAQDVQTNYYDIPVQVGISATPVIDPAINTIFVLARTKDVSGSTTSYVQRLHALDITTGAEQPGSPVVVQATVNGTGIGGNGTQVSFDPLHENPRPGLLLVNGTVYLSWASLEDIEPWHGWVIGYSEATLQQVSVLNTTPNGSAGGIWGGGGGVTADASGVIFATTGNGTFDASTGGADYGQTVLKVTGAGGALNVADYFTPFNQASLNSVDWDLGSGGTVLLPDQPGPFPHLLLAGGKGSTFYEINRDSLGEFSPTANHIVLTVAAVIGPVTETGGSRAGGPAYWQGQVYYAGSGGAPMQFSLLNGIISSLPIAERPSIFGYPGGSPVVSANGNTSGIVWALQTDKYAGGGSAVLHAYDAANISRELFNTNQLASRNAAGPAVKFAVPTVANGKVYIGTQTEVDAYGLLP